MRRNRIAAAVAELSEQLLRPRYLRCVARLLVHDRRAQVDGTRCPCCRSPDAEIVEEVEMVDMVIDLVTGDRIYQAEVAAGDWAEYCAVAERHDIPLRCSTKTRELFLDTRGRHLCLSGAQRASKSTTALYLFALDVLRRGGLNRRAWLVASKDEKCFALLSKLLRPTPVGESGAAPAILPAALVERTGIPNGPDP